MQGNINQQLTDEGARTLNRRRHEAQCSICSHPDRRAIEWAFINGNNCSRIAHDYSVRPGAIYRHARAFDLFSKRLRNTGSVLGRILDEVVGNTGNHNVSWLVAALDAHLELSSGEEKVEPVHSPNL